MYLKKKKTSNVMVVNVSKLVLFTQMLTVTVVSLVKAATTPIINTLLNSKEMSCKTLLYYVSVRSLRRLFKT